MSYYNDNLETCKRCHEKVEELYEDGYCEECYDELCMMDAHNYAMRSMIPTNPLNA